MTRQADAFEFIGRLKGYAGDDEGAIATLTKGIESHPQDARLYRHRGHRYISTRRFEEARDDFLEAVGLLPAWQDHIEYGQKYALVQLEQAVLGTVEPSVLPSLERVRERGEYYSPLAFKVHYHLGLTWHLLGDDEASLASFSLALEHAVNQELLVATANWLVVLHGRLGRQDRDAELLARIDLSENVETNAAYLELLRLYAGQSDPEALLGRARSDSRFLATVGFGLASWLQARDERERAREVLEQIVAEGDRGAFGRIAAEVELGRQS